MAVFLRVKGNSGFSSNRTNLSPILKIFRARVLAVSRRTALNPYLDTALSALISIMLIIDF